MMARKEKPDEVRGFAIRHSTSGVWIPAKMIKKTMTPPTDQARRGFPFRPRRIEAWETKTRKRIEAKSASQRNGFAVTGNDVGLAP